MLSTLVRGVTTVATPPLLSEPMPDPKGNGGVLEAADLVDIYERGRRSFGLHSDSESRASAGPRARELVIGYLTTVGNYDYRLQWSFRQDGRSSFMCILTGIMLTKGRTPKPAPLGAAALAGKAGAFTAAGEQAHAPRQRTICSPHHQHFFNLRLDFDVDAPGTAWRSFNLRTDREIGPTPRQRFLSLTNDLARERDAVRNLNLESHRMWAVFTQLDLHIGPSRRIPD